MDMYRRIAAVCERIPCGKVATYGQIALLCQRPRHARQVGFALSHRQLGDIPAHRIVNAKGVLSGAGAFEQPGQQRLLLEAEGVEVSREGRVDIRKFGWKNTWEEAAELLSCFEKEGI